MSSEAKRAKAVCSVANGLGACGVKRSIAMQIAIETVDDFTDYLLASVQDLQDAEWKLKGGPRKAVRAPERVVELDAVSTRSK